MVPVLNKNKISIKTMQKLVEHLKRAMNDDICCHMEQEAPSPDWAEWVFNESRRRLVTYLSAPRCFLTPKSIE
jgi:hypothetical protein